MLGFSNNCGSRLEIENLRMHTESCPTVKLNAEFDVSSTLNDSSVLDDDLTVGSSTLGLADKSSQEQEVAGCNYKTSDRVVYVNEDTMDCGYSVGTPSQGETRMEVSSPEMFESDDEREKVVEKNFILCQKEHLHVEQYEELEKCEPSREELIVKTDIYLLARMNKFLTGVPPPPKHTICQSDCSDLLAYIRENREYFVVDPLARSDENISKVATPAGKAENTKKSTNGRSFDHRAKSSLRNLTNAFDACDRSDESTIDARGDSTSRGSPGNAEIVKKISENSMYRASSSAAENIDKIRENFTSHGTSINADNVEIINKDTRNREVLSGSGESNLSSQSTSVASSSDNCINKDNEKRVTFKMPKEEPTRFYSTIGVEEAKNLEWDAAYKHKTHGIHYNRSKTIEEFESLTLKLCQRYIGAETQSSCNIWFTKQAPTSVKKRNLLLRRANGQSPGKRLSHLARRRRTFSSANLQVMGMADKKQLVLNIKKPTIRKGKSPRGKSPRGSAKKRASLRPSPSPRKSKLETSKRALFQSPPNDRAGPSNGVASLVNSNPQQRIKRTLFPTLKTKEDSATAPSVNDAKKAIPSKESRKRKNDEDLEGPRFKYAKSLSFDCAHNLESNSADSSSSERHSTGNILMNSEAHHRQGKCELSKEHRKKLLWAVAEALRSRGITMGHPRFKQCASQLAKTVKKYMPDLENRDVPRKPGSVSDRMLRLAKHHVALIVESRPPE